MPENVPEVIVDFAPVLNAPRWEDNHAATLGDVRAAVTEVRPPEEVKYTPPEPLAVWHITHSLDTRRPKVLILDEEEQEIIAFIDWKNATANAISIYFYAPRVGTAYVSK